MLTRARYGRGRITAIEAMPTQHFYEFDPRNGRVFSCVARRRAVSESDSSEGSYAGVQEKERQHKYVSRRPMRAYRGRLLMCSSKADNIRRWIPISDITAQAEMQYNTHFTEGGDGTLPASGSDVERGASGSRVARGVSIVDVDALLEQRRLSSEAAASSPKGHRQDDHHHSHASTSESNTLVDDNSGTDSTFVAATSNFAMSATRACTSFILLTLMGAFVAYLSAMLTVHLTWEHPQNQNQNRDRVPALLPVVRMNGHAYEHSPFTDYDDVIVCSMNENENVTVDVDLIDARIHRPPLSSVMTDIVWSIYEISRRSAEDVVTLLARATSSLRRTNAAVNMANIASTPWRFRGSTRTFVATCVDRFLLRVQNAD